MSIEQNDTAGFAEGVGLNQQRLGAALKSQYDLIVCGSGSSGSVCSAPSLGEPRNEQGGDKADAGEAGVEDVARIG